MKARIFWIAIAAAVLALIGVRIAEDRKKTQTGQESVSRVQVVKTVRLRREPIEERQVFTGTVRPRNEVDLFAKLPGRIESVLVQVGDKVKAGQVLATVEHKEISWQAKAAEAAVALAQANLTSAQQELARTEALFKGGSAPEAQLDGMKTRAVMAQAQLAQAEAAAGLARQQVANARVETPIEGTVVRKNVNLGAMAAPGLPLFTVQDVAKLKLESSVDAAVFSRLAKGAQAQLSVDTLPGQLFPGKVSVLSPTLDIGTRRAAVELEVDNPNGKLLPNMFASAAVTVGRVPDALVLHKDSLLFSSQGVTAFRVKDGKLQAVHPKLGAQEGDRYQVLSELAEGDEVVLGGLPALADGLPVKATLSSLDPLTRKE